MSYLSVTFLYEIITKNSKRVYKVGNSGDVSLEDLVRRSVYPLLLKALLYSIAFL